LPDGTKVTMHADGPQRVVHTTSIYDGAQSHEIGNVGNVVRHSCVNAATARHRDAAESDGETAFASNPLGTGQATGALLGANIYTEGAGDPGARTRTWLYTLLGLTGEWEVNPNQINDYYDDPRLGHT
jgi:hypothetical protein